ncbi:MAG: phenylalanine--tRNA ligase subunit beta [Micrococcales bacterium 73-15]|uniref:phenylalanine--tRNA ligase subunit beta n=1 Tax=Salana multivorans TaxID=120377 RepID=UPI0009658FB2|nr:phenylalanine--tRNA ligase subunit beta [Salana multivorans]OJX95576.1 MAG: phenylalanine--tRNA ligase subunit beta [Micrococcales bacterium 73-15]
MPYVVMPWLGEHVELPKDLTAERLAADLVRVGLEEEAIHSSGVTGPLVVGRVLERTPEPQKNGKVINWCQLDTGERTEDGEVVPRGVICGAHNFEVGDAVVVALPGAVLPGDFVIASRKTYGHVSNGMICSAEELGLADDPRYAGDGIIVLATAAELADDSADSAHLAPGTDALALLGLADEVLEINVTPDRGYCFSVRGVAREYAHATGARFTDPGLPAPAGSAPATPEPTTEAFAVEIDDDAPIHGVVGCDRFVTRVVRGVDPAAPSPQWLQERLRKAGMRPISLAVDATNYVMLDLGQPLHAYDLARVHEPIVVRRARAGERLVTLDDADRALDAEDLLITDSPDGVRGARPIGIGGVMGGASTEVSDATTDVLVEAAHFDPVTIARSARRHKLPSEASRRFERGVDTRLQAIAAQRVVDLLVTYGGGTADDARVGDVGVTTAAAPIVLDPAAVSALVGVDYTEDEVHDTLVEIGADVQAILSSGEDSSVTHELLVTPPTWRPDLTAPEDLIEEVVRLRGYDAVPSVLPHTAVGHGLTREQRLRRGAQRTLAEAGLVQVLSFPFVSPQVHDDLGEPVGDERRSAERLANPMADDAPELRTSLLATLLPVAARNLARGAGEVAVYEVGMVTRARPGGPGLLPAGGSYPGEDVVAALLKSVPEQEEHAAAVLASAGRAGSGAESAETAIALAVRLASSLGAVVEVHARPVTSPRAPFHPGRCAELTTPDGFVLGHAGELAPSVARAFGLGARPAAFELDLGALVTAAGNGLAAGPVGKLSTFPLAKEDLAFAVDARVPAETVRRTILEAAGDLAESVELFDVYEGEQVGEGRRSLAFALRLRAGDHTLTAAETAAVREAAVALVAERLGGELRA